MPASGAVQVQMLRHHNVSDVLEAEVHHELELVRPTFCACLEADGTLPVSRQPKK